MLPIQDEVIALVHQLHNAYPFPKKPLPSGASDVALAAFTERTGVPMPEELRVWLERVNGPIVGPGGTYGLRQMEEEYQWFPEWRRKGWIKVADDGCGDPYVLDTSTTVGGTHPVYFIDHETYEGDADYVVASGLWVFLRFLLSEDLASLKAVLQSTEREASWPFNPERVLAEDPSLAQYRGPVPLPWETS